MIAKEELIKIGKLKGLNNLGYIEKDYLLELILLSISRNTKNELIFKGGTCLYKFYKLDRFSEDLDFSETKESNLNLLVKQVLSDLERFGISSEIKEKKEPLNSILYSLRIQGPLYTGAPQTTNKIRIDINRKSKTELKPVSMRFTSLYPEIPSFYALIMQEKEILAEKIRAVLTRDKARDLYDLWFLIGKGVEIDYELIKKKLEYYNLHFSLKDLRTAITKKEKIWKMELKPFLDNLPNFQTVEKIIMDAFRN